MSLHVENASLLAALLIGFTGGVHCVGMCGGIVGVLSMSAPLSPRTGKPVLFPYLIAYNSGRVLSYTAAGALVGGVGLVAANLTALHQAQSLLQGLAALFMLALGAYLAGVWQGLAQVERAGDVLWRRLEPVGRRLLPVRNPLHALVLGAIWGWLPCGLVYSMLIWSLSAGGALEGAMLMLAFGLGTLPNLIAAGWLASRLRTFTRQPWVRRTAGALVAAFGLLMLYRLL